MCHKKISRNIYDINSSAQFSRTSSPYLQIVYQMRIINGTLIDSYCSEDMQNLITWSINHDVHTIE